MSAASKAGIVNVDLADGEPVIATGYLVQPAMNGGWIVHDSNFRENWRESLLIGSFSNSVDLLEWLATQHARLREQRPERTPDELIIERK